MIKRIFCGLLLFLMVCCMAGCNADSNTTRYPKINIIRTGWTMDDFIIDISHLDINDNKLYEIIYNDDGADVIIHCIYKEDNK